MTFDLDAAIRDFLMLFVTIDPIGTISLFVPLTARLPAHERRRVALRAIVCGGAILFAFMVVGQIVLNGLGVTLVSFRVAGAIILFLLGLQMVFGTGIAEETQPEAGRDIAIFPLGIPSIAGPGAIMAVVVLTDNDQFATSDQLVTAAVLLVVLVITWLAMRAANGIQRFIGETGASALVRVMGLLLCALAAETVLESIVEMMQDLGRAA